MKVEDVKCTHATGRKIVLHERSSEFRAEGRRCKCDGWVDRFEGCVSGLAERHHVVYISSVGIGQVWLIPAFVVVHNSLVPRGDGLHVGDPILNVSCFCAYSRRLPRLRSGLSGPSRRPSGRSGENQLQLRAVCLRKLYVVVEDRESPAALCGLDAPPARIEVSGNRHWGVWPWPSADIDRRYGAKITCRNYRSRWSSLNRSGLRVHIEGATTTGCNEQAQS